MLFVQVLFSFFKQQTAYEMRISDWSSDVCSSDLHGDAALAGDPEALLDQRRRAGVDLRRPHHAGHPAGRMAVGLVDDLDGALQTALARRLEIGRASCRERVCQ